MTAARTRRVVERALVKANATLAVARKWRDAVRAELDALGCPVEGPCKGRPLERGGADDGSICDECDYFRPDD